MVAAGNGIDLETAETLDSVDLRDALEALLEAGDPGVLYEGLPEPGEDASRQAWERASVEARRIKRCRDAVLYSAFAAEAFINSFIAAESGAVALHSRLE